MWRFTSDLCENHETQGSAELGVGFVLGGHYLSVVFCCDIVPIMVECRCIGGEKRQLMRISARRRLSSRDSKLSAR
jgi:hypothetical protein